MAMLLSLVWFFRLVLLVALAGVTYLALMPAQAVSLGSDKTNHVVAFAVLGVLARLGFLRSGVVAVMFPLFIYGVLIEAMQYQVGRFAGMDDLVANLVGLGIASVSTLFIQKQA